MKRVCIVGYGAIGPVHAKALETIQNAELYGICDIDERHLQLGIEEHHVKPFLEYSEVLKDPMVDCVHICTPHYLHYEMICQALSAGKDVVSEKPVTMTQEQYLTLLDKERAEKVCVVLQNRWNPCVQKLKRIVEEKTLGQVQTLKGYVTWCRTKEYYDHDAWRGKWATEGGGVLINQSIHTLDLMCYLVGNVKSISADMSNLSLQDVIEVEDTVAARLEFENHITGIFFATNAYADNSSPFLEILFDHGIVRYMDGQLWVNGEKVEEDQKSSIGKVYWGVSHEKLLQKFYEEERWFSVFDIRNTMMTMFGIYASAAENGRRLLIE